MDAIEYTLQRLFNQHRIVVWTDAESELTTAYNELWLLGVEKIAIDDNEFAVKHRILREEPDSKFLLYRPGPPPDDRDNWLLDVELAAGAFRADQAALWLLELGLDQTFMELPDQHEPFFQAAARRAALKTLLDDNDSARQIRLKMLAVAASAEPQLDTVLEQLLNEVAAGRDERFRLIERCQLEAFLWQQVGWTYGYTAEAPTMRDFALSLYDHAYRSVVDNTYDEPILKDEAIVFLRRWKDNVHHRAAFMTLAQTFADILGVRDDIAQRNAATLARSDLFPDIDRQIISDLIHAVTRRTMTADEVEALVRRRRVGIWFDEYSSLYETVEAGAAFLDLRDRLDLAMSSLADGARRYSETWFQLDQHYRHFIQHLRASREVSALRELATLVENHYSNSYLLPLNNAWQAHVDSAAGWEAGAILRQDAFYERVVKPYGKVAVIISDALRYEIGDELQRLICQEDRYEAELEPALTLLPSFTQLGMAALLPHSSLRFSENGETILVDDLSSQGTANRNAILDTAVPQGGTALAAETLLDMDRDESRALVRDHAVVYIYHNQIDATGDKRDSEERVFDEAQATLDALLRVIKKLAAANVNNMIITADHGFIYQHEPLAESDFVADPVDRHKALVYKRRYVLGHSLQPTPSVRKFTAGQVGLAGEMDILIPKSINRLRVSGAGSRYVHGGAALQEVIIPVIRVNKKRQSDVEQVEVEILRPSTAIITTGQVTVSLYQTEPVTGKRQPRTLRAGIYTEDGELISDQQTAIFDFSDEDERQRELRLTLRLSSAADDANGQDVWLRLEQPVADTSRYTTYKSLRYTIRRTFTSDFD